MYQPSNTSEKDTQYRWDRTSLVVWIRRSLALTYREQENFDAADDVRLLSHLVIVLLILIDEMAAEAEITPSHSPPVPPERELQCVINHPLPPPPNELPPCVLELDSPVEVTPPPTLPTTPGRDVEMIISPPLSPAQLELPPCYFKSDRLDDDTPPHTPPDADQRG